MKIPPPLLFATSFAAGLLLDARIPMFDGAVSPHGGVRWLAVLLICAGIALLLSSAALFLRSRTTIIPHRMPTVFVSQGAYRWTRNPMYVGFTLVYFGLAAWLVSPWAAVLLPVPVLLVDRLVIPMEERHLEEAFGASYVAYMRRVRRWL